MTDGRLDDAPDRRELLLERIVDFVLENGVSQLTLRGLAAAVGSNNRMLLYYFGSREELIIAALAGAEQRFAGMAGIVPLLDDTSLAIEHRLLGAWRILSDPVTQPLNRLFFEIFGLAGFEQQRFRSFLGEVGSEWVQHVAAALCQLGVPDARAELLAHEVVALWRGFQATLLSGGDAVVVDAAAHDALRSVLARASVTPSPNDTGSLQNGPPR